MTSRVGPFSWIRSGKLQRKDGNEATLGSAMQTCCYGLILIAANPCDTSKSVQGQVDMIPGLRQRH